MASSAIWQKKPAAAPILEAFERIEAKLASVAKARHWEGVTALEAAYRLAGDADSGLTIETYQAIESLRQVREVVAKSPVSPSPKVIGDYLRTAERVERSLAGVPAGATRTTH